MYMVYAILLLFFAGQTQQSLNLLAKIRNIRSGKFLGVNTTKSGSNLVYADDGLQYYDWILEPNCHSDSKKPSYRVRLADKVNFRWDHRSGCSHKDTDLVIYNQGSGTAFNNYFVYDSELRTIQVCKDNCIFVEPTTKQVKSSQECSTKKCAQNKFDILFQDLKEPTSTSSLNLDCFE
ncbi:uncharacterized protein LOC114348746 [Diabrotica virgifera virgifera]|uniref:Uncharacterized protein n=1 Tax=Diabrotica virgifera virgifera TaxID=50390 RepID=A0ABM5J031_DIAVI|nr:uncharacterized protein LOC114348746 [Diabrotica virgifera virgifera]